MSLFLWISICVVIIGIILFILSVLSIKDSVEKLAGAILILILTYAVIAFLFIGTSTTNTSKYYLVPDAQIDWAIGKYCYVVEVEYLNEDMTRLISTTTGHDKRVYDNMLNDKPIIILEIQYNHYNSPYSSNIIIHTKSDKLPFLSDANDITIGR